MSTTRLFALALAAGLLAASGCGSSTKSSATTSSTSPASTTSQAAHTTASAVSSGPLTRAQLIEKGNEICYRLNARRQSTSLGRPKDYEHVVPALAAYELAGATEMANLDPPTSLASYWGEMVAAAHTIAEVTGRFSHFSEASNEKLARPYDIMLGKAINQIKHAAKQAGFKECAQFS